VWSAEIVRNALTQATGYGTELHGVITQTVSVWWRGGKITAPRRLQLDGGE
jgi:hypothetical protein